MDRRIVWARRGLMIVLAVVICQQIWRHGRDYVFADQFHEVVPGKIYRGAWQQPWPMRRIVRDYKIKTVLALAHWPDDPLCVRERKMADEMGFRWVHIPIVDDRAAANGKDVSDLLEQAAAVLADSKNYPIYFHCHHGINRASMVQMAYRMLYCDWTLEQATDEIARDFEMKPINHGPDHRHMTQFYQERVLPRRRSRALAAMAGPSGSGAR
jgi:protein-tyrosine phosphatase